MTNTSNTEIRAKSLANKKVQSFLKSLYKLQLKRLVERFSVGDPVDRGFYTSMAQRMNKALEKHGLSLTSTFANDLYTGRKIGRDGVSLSLAYRLGVLLSGKAEPENAIALFYVWVCGLWPEKTSAGNILESIEAADMSYKELVEQVKSLIEDSEKRQDEKLNRVLAAIEGKPASAENEPTKFHPLSVALKELNPCSDADTVAAVNKLFEGYPESAESVIGILVTGEVKPTKNHWLSLSYAMNKLTGEMWPPAKIEKLAKEHQPADSQSSKSESAAVEPK